MWANLAERREVSRANLKEYLPTKSMSYPRKHMTLLLGSSINSKYIALVEVARQKRSGNRG